MSTFDHNSVSAKELDNLLAQAFLNLDFNDPKNIELMETVSTHHLINRSAFSFNWTKNFLNKFLIGALLAVIIGMLVFMLIPAAQPPHQNSTNAMPVSSPKTTDETENFIAESAFDTETDHVPVRLQNTESSFDPENRNTSIPTIDHRSGDAGQIPYFSHESAKQKQDSTYIFPKLTEEETKQHYKQKNKMIAALIKLNKANYAYIPTGSCTYKDQVISVQAFYAQTTEVSNLEYRTFLNDLVVQNRKQDFLTALPDQAQWINKVPTSYNEPMAENYFSQPLYDHYPVVNISRKGAELYCKWLTEETNKVLKKNNKPLIMDLRLPDEYEWAYAAFNGKNELHYANGNKYLRNSKGCYEMNYLCYSIEECNYDSTHNLYLPKVDLQKAQLDGGFYTVKTTSYLANNYGLYCMAGNVAEMIILHDSQKPATKGGSWFSTDHFLEIEAEDEYHGETNASPFIGFRPVMTMMSTE